jgi:hypothetical protein
MPPKARGEEDEAASADRRRRERARYWYWEQMRLRFHTALVELLDETTKSLRPSAFDVARMLSVSVGVVWRWKKSRPWAYDAEFPPNDKLDIYTNLLRTEFRARGGEPLEYDEIEL